jgi:hypothetical protein
MSGTQKFFKAILPRRWFESWEARSRSYMVRCSCGFAKSVWEWGGMIWAASGNKRLYRTCPKCGQLSWHKVSHEPTAPQSSDTKE